MQFFNPIWLFALVAISIPVVIHLWNIRPGKTLKVGSIALFCQSSPKSSRSLQLTDVLLLLLRCLLLILLAILLAGPLWQQRLQNTKAKGWVMIPKENFNDAYQHFKLTIDSLNYKGFEFHYFDKGFPKADLNEIVQHPGKDTTVGQAENYWDLIKQLTRHAPSHIEIFTPNTVTHFAGDKLQINQHIHWHTFTPADSVSTWLAGAWLSTKGTIRVVQGTAKPSGTIYRYNNINNGGTNNGLYQVSVEHGLPVMYFKNSRLSVDTSTQRFAIYTDKYMLDANYLKAALTAASQFTGRKTIIKLYSQSSAIPPNQDWLFWLSDSQIGQTAKKANNVFVYDGGKVSETDTWMSNTGDNVVAQGQAKVYVYQTVASVKATGNTIWIDGFGKPVLSTEKGQTNIYHFYSRFTPAFSDLVWSDEFPKWLLTLTNPYKTPMATHDHRILSTGQIVPSYNNQKSTTDNPTDEINLSRYLWFALILVFFAERWLATSNKTTLSNG